MTHSLSTIRPLLAQITIGIAALMACTAHAASPYERGPAPTTASLEAAAGPFAIKSAKIASPSGYGGGTVYYPITPNQYGLVVIAPGFTEKQSVNSWWGERLASHGFVAVTIDTKTTLDQPESRAKQLMAAVTQVSSLSKNITAPYYNRIDTSRAAVMGHSMGGGGSLAAARDNPSLKAIIPLAPWHTIKDFSGVKVPTMIIACEKDIIAPIDTHATTFYASLTYTLDKAYLEMDGAGHFCTNTLLSNAAQRAVEGKLGVAWLKRFVDEDTRYTPFLLNTNTSPAVSKYTTGGEF